MWIGGDESEGAVSLLRSSAVGFLAGLNDLDVGRPLSQEGTSPRARAPASMPPPALGLEFGLLCRGALSLFLHLPELGLQGCNLG